MSDSVRWRIYEYFSLENDQVKYPPTVLRQAPRCRTPSQDYPNNHFKET